MFRDWLPQTLQFPGDSFVSFSLLAFKWRKKFPISRHFSSSAVNKPSATSDSPPLPTPRQPRAFFLLQGTALAATPSTHALMMTPSRSRVTSLSLRTSPPPPHMFTRWAIAAAWGGCNWNISLALRRDALEKINDHFSQYGELWLPPSSWLRGRCRA